MRKNSVGASFRSLGLRRHMPETIFHTRKGSLSGELLGILEQRAKDSRQPMSGKPAKALANLSGLTAYLFLPQRKSSNWEQYQYVPWPRTLSFNSFDSVSNSARVSSSWSRRFLLRLRSFWIIW